AKCRKRGSSSRSNKSSHQARKGHKENGFILPSCPLCPFVRVVFWPCIYTHEYTLGQKYSHYRRVTGTGARDRTAVRARRRGWTFAGRVACRAAKQSA